MMRLDMSGALHESKVYVGCDREHHEGILLKEKSRRLGFKASTLWALRGADGQHLFAASSRSVLFSMLCPYMRCAYILNNGTFTRTSNAHAFGNGRVRDGALSIAVWPQTTYTHIKKEHTSNSQTASPNKFFLPSSLLGRLCFDTAKPIICYPCQSSVACEIGNPRCGCGTGLDFLHSFDIVEEVRKLHVGRVLQNALAE